MRLLVFNLCDNLCTTLTRLSMIAILKTQTQGKDSLNRYEVEYIFQQERSTREKHANGDRSSLYTLGYPSDTDEQIHASLDGIPPRRPLKKGFG